jgi:2-keto-4-pentenoate hydratase
LIVRDNTAHPAHAAEEQRAIAERFVQARMRGGSLPDFPGAIPLNLVSAYAVQDIAIAQWQDAVAGWKIGYIAPSRRDASGDERLLGPVFAKALWQATPGLRFPIYAGGFSAVEAEFVLRLDADAPADKRFWTTDEAAAFPATLFTGVEIASSPLATINQLGPCVVVSDFGNHNGLVLGAEILDWQNLDEQSLTCQTFIDGIEVGSGGAGTLPGGLRAAFAFALARSAKRGYPLRKGQWIATGNATGIHDIKAGQIATIRFDGYGEISCTAVTASSSVA